MNSNFKFNTPVLFLVFNRLDTTKKVFEEIIKAKPKQLFIALDGPRNQEEKIKTDAVRKYVLDNIDWRCEVKTLLRDKNLGCKYAVAGAIDWFFENVEQGIILEDDCVPSQSFFRFCQEMLEKYKEDTRIMQVGGTNVMSGKNYGPESYFFSTKLSPWGWATWKRSWALYDIKMDNYEKLKSRGLLKMMKDQIFTGIIGRKGYKDLRSGKMDTWDYQWYTSCILNNGLGIISKINLIRNIGFLEGTHTTNGMDNKSLPRQELNFPLRENNIVIDNDIYGEDFAKFFKKGRIVRKLKSILAKI